MSMEAKALATSAPCQRLRWTSMCLYRLVYMSFAWFGSRRPISRTCASNERRIRTALDWHWAASEAGDRDGEHIIYSDSAILEYPQSGERICGRQNIQSAHARSFSGHGVKVRRFLGQGNIWVTEYMRLNDAQPIHTVSIMEFCDGKVFRETRYFADGIAELGHL